MATDPDPVRAVYQMNELMQEAGLLDRFVTLVMSLLDPATHQVTFVNAGHLPPLIYLHAQRKVEETFDPKLAGFPLGVAEGIPYEGTPITLEPGDGVILLTEGITEAKNRQDADFMMEAVYRSVENGPTDARAIGQRLVDAVKQHALGRKQHDDITVVCFSR